MAESRRAGNLGRRFLPLPETSRRTQPARRISEPVCAGDLRHWCLPQLQKKARTPICGTTKKICGSRSHHLRKPQHARDRLTATARRCLPGSGHRKLQADGVTAVCQLQARAGFGSIQAHSCAVAAARQLQCVRICHILSCHPQARWVCTRLRHIGARPFTPSPIGQANHSINTVLNVWVSAKADYSSDRRCT